MEQSSSVDYHIYCPSYRRANLAISHKLFAPETFSYVVREEEVSLYSHLGVNLIPIPSGRVANLTTTRNWIMDNLKSKYMVQVDDDISTITWILKRKHNHLSPEDIHHAIQNGFRMAEDIGAGMWGMNVNHDPKAYRIHCPFNFCFPTLGPFQALLDTSLRYDEEIYLKEDYDMFLQQLNKHRTVLRVNFLSYICDHQKMEGGCQTYRTSELEKEQNLLLQKKWGSRLIKENSINPGSINMIVKTGLGR